MGKIQEWKQKIQNKLINKVLSNLKNFEFEFIKDVGIFSTLVFFLYIYFEWSYPIVSNITKYKIDSWTKILAWDLGP